MLKTTVYSKEGTEIRSVELPEKIFGIRPHQHVLYESVVNYLNNQRQGTSSALNRNRMSGGGRKPWRQKGTGNARAGSNTSPLWVGGGRAFPPHPRDYYRHLPKKVRNLALKSAFSLKAQQNEIQIIEDLSFEKPSTKTLYKILINLRTHEKKNLLLITENNKNIYLSGRNIHQLKVLPIKEVTAYDLLNCNNLILTEKAYQQCVDSGEKK